MPHCSAACADGKPCRAFAKGGSLFCAQHLPTGELPPVGAYSMRFGKREPLDGDLYPIPAGAASGLVGVPARLPQPTFVEAKILGQAVANGESLTGWVPGDLDENYLFIAPGTAFRVKLVPDAMAEWYGSAPTLQAMEAELRGLTAPAKLLLLVATALVIEQPMMRTTPDELIHAIGWEPDGATEREEMRRRVWRWLLLFGCFHVLGQRNEVYRERGTGRTLQMKSRDVLFRVMGVRTDGDPLALDLEPPHEVILSAGPWVEQWRGQPSITTYFANLRRIAAIPAGRTPGIWAQAIGLALNQTWREKSQFARVERNDAGDVETVRFQNTTRRHLFGVFPVLPSVEEILKSTDPGRAREYWDDAVALLKRERVIGHYHEVTPLPVVRQGWRAAWLAQPLDIRPTPDVALEAAAISTSAAWYRQPARKTQQRKK